jgi:hypothetical protein
MNPPSAAVFSSTKTISNKAEDKNGNYPRPGPPPSQPTHLRGRRVEPPRSLPSQTSKSRPRKKRFYGGDGGDRRRRPHHPGGEPHQQRQVHPLQVPAPLSPSLPRNPLFPMGSMARSDLEAPSVLMLACSGLIPVYLMDSLA